MRKRTKAVKKTAIEWLFAGFSWAVILLSFLLFVPVHVALSAGIGGLSLVIFSVAALILTLIIRFIPIETRWVRAGLSLSLFLAVVSVGVPQFGYYTVAKSVGAKLSFSPVEYLRFSGKTTIPPSATFTYKQVGEESLQIAFYGEQDQQHPKPTVMLLHGGGWRYGTHTETGRWPEVLTRAGYQVASVQYRLSSPDHTSWQQAPSDIHDALKFLKDHASDFGVDSSRLSLMGQSAGGHLALLEAYKNAGVYSVISLYAPIDLALDYTTSRDKSSEIYFVGGSPSEFPDRYQTLSPAAYVSPTSPRTLILQGKRDDLVATQNAVELSNKLADNGVWYQTVLLPYTGHSFENQRGGFATQIAEQVVVDFLGR